MSDAGGREMLVITFDILSSVFYFVGPTLNRGADYRRSQRKRRIRVLRSIEGRNNRTWVGQVGSGWDVRY